MRTHVFRLTPHEDLRASLLRFAASHNIRAGIVLTCVGSLEQLHLRFANQEEGFRQTGHFEILSLSGTLSGTSLHLHLCVADHTGRTMGGHLLSGNLVYTTAEIAVGELTDLVFSRKEDPAYGYQELVIQKEGTS